MTKGLVETKPTRAKPALGYGIKENVLGTRKERVKNGEFEMGY
jgi:hypothetical protein